MMTIWMLTLKLRRDSKGKANNLVIYDKIWDTTIFYIFGIFQEIKDNYFTVGIVHQINKLISTYFSRLI